MVNAVSSNLLGGALRGNPNDIGVHAETAAYGQQAGDAVSIGIGLLETTLSVIRQNKIEVVQIYLILKPDFHSCIRDYQFDYKSYMVPCFSET
ncbi:MAG: hypothetical protein IPG55_09695 [Saprospiraceae bacterium]|nr:hypothetical protein [Candidatus Defluviibacterium haderslevense]